MNARDGARTAALKRPAADKPAPESGKPASFTVLECRADGCTAEFWLNDIPMGRCSLALGTFEAGPCHERLVAGRNVLTMVVEPGEAPAQALAGMPGAGTSRQRRSLAGGFAEMRLKRYPHGATVGQSPGEELLHLRWQAEAWPMFVPLVRSATVDLPLLPDGSRQPWWWQQCERLASLTPEVSGELLALLKQWRLGLQIGRLDDFLEADLPRQVTLARAYGQDIDERLAQLLQRYDQPPRRFFRRIDEASASLRLCAEGRLVQMVDNTGEPLLRMAADSAGGVSSMPLFVGRLEGRWQVLL